MSGVDPAGMLPPGSTIGILGSGQLGRMLACAAARLGFRCHILADTSGPAFDVAARSTVARYEDDAALAAFADAVDVVTYEFENVPVDAARRLSRLKPVRPGPLALEVSQDRLSEKTFISRLRIPVAPFAAIDRAEDVARELARLGGKAILKTRRLGYDGKGQVRLSAGDSGADAFEVIGRQPAVLEQLLAFEREISVLVVRGVAGGMVFYDVPENVHREGILRTSRVPAALPARIEAAAQDMAGRIATALDYVGVLAVEMFQSTEAGTPLIVNEIAPRVHNSGHWTMDACAVGQFENHIRAVAGWAPASTVRHSDAEMRNLIGHDVDAWPELAAMPNACLHLYGKREARPGRKMGHLNLLSPLSRPAG